MKCNCTKKAIYHRRYSGQLFCEDCFNIYFEKKVLDTIRKYKLIRRGDKIGVGISGGKDSTVLFHILKKLSNDLGITLQPILIDEGIKGYRKSGTAAAKKTCSTLAIKLNTASFKKSVSYTMDELADIGELKPCTYCGIIRRKMLNQKAKELGLDRIATGHNLDDEAQVITMNYLSGDIERLHRLSGNVENKSLIKRIKPISRIPEKEIMIYALINKLNISSKECPYSKTNYRTHVRNFLNKLEIDRPGIKFSIVGGWERFVESSHSKTDSLQTCMLCGQASARKVCRACALIEEIKIKMSDAS
jgi:uncharacterized protein (TIGR00269 family)